MPQLAVQSASFSIALHAIECSRAEDSISGHTSHSTRGLWCRELWELMVDCWLGEAFEI